MTQSQQPTERLYYTDASLREFTAAVVEISADGRTVYLDRSAFYPASGGQPADKGMLAGIVVEDVRDEDDRVAHVLREPFVATGESGGIGATVHGEIDWERRRDHMQQHTGQHLLSAVIEALFGLKTVSVHFGADLSTVELAGAEFTAEQARQAEERCFDLIREARPVTISFEDAASVEGLRKASERTGALRIVSIEGIDRSACGGTHVSSLAEVGLILIRRRERIRGNTRVEFVAGRRALARAQRDYEIAAELSRTATVAVDDLPQQIGAWRARLADAEKERDRLRMEIARRDGQALYRQSAPDANGIRRAWLEVAAVSEETRVVLQAFVEGGRAIAAGVATGAVPAIVVAASADAGIHAGNVLKQAFANGGGKGGGSAALAQGAASDPRAAAALKGLLGFE